MEQVPASVIGDVNHNAQEMSNFVNLEAASLHRATLIKEPGACLNLMVYPESDCFDDGECH